METPDDADAARPPEREVVERLVAGHREFLRFLRARIRDPAAAEDILQSAFVRSLETAGHLRDRESAVAWFYRLLRNAVVDHYRRSGRDARRLDPDMPEDVPGDEAEMRGAVCACVNTLIPTLKPEYAEVIRRVDMDEQPLAEAAAALGITPNNASVRLHRARQGLKKQLERSCGTCATHGCLDCGCASAPRATPPL